MARIFKQTYTKPLPSGAEVLSKSGRQFARFKGEKGKTVIAPLSDNGQQVIRETAKWYIEYKDADGTLKRVPGFVDKAATEQRASELERTAEHVRSGYKPREFEHLVRPLLDQLADLKSDMLAKGITQKQAQLVYNRAERVIDGCGFKFWSDIEATKIQRFLADLRKKNPIRKRGISVQTSNWYLQAMKTFCRWLVDESRAHSNPLSHLKRLNVRTDLRHERRALTAEECHRLLTATSKGRTLHGCSGNERALLYRTALESGLRASELKTLRVRKCNVDSKPPVLVVDAAYSKHRSEDIQPIPQSLAESLRTYIADRSPDELLFKHMPEIQKLARVLKSDLKSASIPYADEQGRVADFHALRHTFISNLAQSGVHPKTAMDLARHRDINLTMLRYSHTRIADRAAVLDSLPDLVSSARPETAKATGTYGKVAGTNDLACVATSQTTSRVTSNSKSLQNKCLGNPTIGLENRFTAR
jgi:integrase